MHIIEGYSNGRTIAIGKVLIEVEVDLARDKVETIVILNEVHTVPILVD